MTVMHRRQLLALLGLLWPTPGAAEASPYVARELRDFDEDVTSLREQARGQALVVVVMKGHWCRVCIAQLRRLGAEKRRLAKLHAKVVGLNTDSVKANRSMAAQQRLVFPVLSDERHVVVDQLGLWLSDLEHPMPAIVVFDHCGKEVARQVGRRPGARPEGPLFELLEKLDHDRRACSGHNA